MKTKHWFALILVFIMSLCLSVALAEEPEAPAYYDSYWKGLSQDGNLNRSYELTHDMYGNPYYTSGPYYWLDYETGTAMLLCSRLECPHTQPADLFREESLLDKMNRTSVCYAWRLAGIPITGPVMYEGKLYGLYIFPDIFSEGNEFRIYEMEIDGPMTEVASLDHLFTWEQEPSCDNFIIYDGYAYLNVLLTTNRNLDSERAEALKDIPRQYALYRVSLTTGEATELTRISAQSCTCSLMGLVDDVLYFSQTQANDLTPQEQVISFDERIAEIKEKDRFSLLGVNVSTGEQVVLDEALCGLKRVYGSIFDIVKDKHLYMVIPPQTAEDNTAHFVTYDLETRTRTADYPFEYDDEDDFRPYYVLNDTTVLTFSFQAGEFALRDYQSGETTKLDLRGSCIYGNEGEYYGISSLDNQPRVIPVERHDAEGGLHPAYITLDELLHNGTPHDFEMLN